MIGAALKKKSKLETRGGDGGKDERNKRAEEGREDNTLRQPPRPGSTLDGQGAKSRADRKAQRARENRKRGREEAAAAAAGAAATTALSDGGKKAGLASDGRDEGADLGRGASKRQRKDVDPEKTQKEKLGKKKAIEEKRRLKVLKRQVTKQQKSISLID